MKTQTTGQLTLTAISAIFTFLLFSGCEKDTEMYSLATAAQSVALNPLVQEGLATPLAIAQDKPGQISVIPGYEETKRVLLTGYFSPDQGLPMAGKPAVEFEINQVISYPSRGSKPVLRDAKMTVTNLLLHSVNCRYTLKFGTVGFPWEISADLVLKPSEELDLGLLPSFSGMITDSPFEISLTGLLVYDESDKINSIE